MSNVRSRGVSIALGAIVGVLLWSPASAQQASGIAGIARDTSGAVLPGVTVEAASPALIEKVRSVVTDGEGRYNIVDLRPGTYSVTFSLSGFRTFRRDGITLQSGFTATVNADMSVGALEETITVTGAAPLVDTQNVRRQTVAAKDLLDALPTGTQHVSTLVTLTAGFSGIAEVGGQYQSQVGGGGNAGYHGKTGSKVAFDGMGIENSSGNSSYQINTAIVQEMVLQTSGISAESNADGPVLNVVPKEGGNTFSGTLSALYANDSLEGSNLNDTLRARGLNTENKTLKVFDQALGVGGPILRDKLWFFGAARTWGFSRIHAGVFWNKTQGTHLTPPGENKVVVLFTPWVDKPEGRFSGRMEWYDSYLGRLTWQASLKHKFNFTFDEQEACNCGSTSATTMQEAGGGYRFEPNRLLQLAWSAPLTNRLLLEAGVGSAISQWNQFWMPGVEPNHIAIQDQGLGISYGAQTTYRGNPNNTDRHTQRFSVSYVTGSHSFKTGVLLEEFVRNNYYTANGALSYRFRDGVPNQITQRATPYLIKERIKPEMGVFVQDQWKLDRLTVNLGVRYDFFRGYIPPQEAPGETNGWAGAARENPWLPSRSFASVSDVPAWHDISPRVGGAYDLFGDGRTAIKASLGRYVAKTSTNITSAINPIETSVISTNRAWTDANSNYVPDCDLGNFAANGECGAIDNANFGQNNPRATRWADDVLRGWGNRDYNWDFSLELQQEINAGLSLTTGYYRNTGGYFTAQSDLEAGSKVRAFDNLAVTPADFDPYCITAPRDPRLPGGGGYQVCGLYDINPAKFGQSDILVRRLDNFGEFQYMNDFFNVSFEARPGRGIRLGGGFDTGRSVADGCFVVDSPQSLLNCRVVTPFKANSQVKLHASVPLPADFVVAATFQNVPGPAILANYAASSAEIGPSLGRPLAGGTRTATVPLVAPRTLFEDRLTRVDLRLTKIVALGNRLRLQLNLDAYNAFNNSSVRSVNSTYGSRWLEPTSVLDPRLVQFGGSLSF